MEQYVTANGIRLHYLDFPGGDPPLLLLHGLTANAHLFDGLIEAGLSPSYRLLIPDFRGRGLSDKPESGYTIADHAADILGLLDAQNIARIIFVGWSFGGYVSYYIAANYPDRVDRLIIIDSPASIHPKVREMIQPSVDRLGRIAPSWPVFVEAMKQLPFFDGYWDSALEAYFVADVEERSDGTLMPRARREAIAGAMDGVIAEDWIAIVRLVKQPVLFLNGPEPYGPPGSQALVSKEQAMETVNLLPNGRYRQIPGNHFTMGYGRGATEIVKQINAFVHSTLS